MTAPSGQHSFDPGFRVLSFLAHELHGVFGRIGRALDAHLAGEELPQPLFGNLPANEGQLAPAPKRRGRPRKDEGKQRRTRRPTAFNIFIKRRIEALKAEGVGTTDANARGVFKRAVEDWGNLTEAQRTTFTEEYKAELEGEEAAATPSPPPQSPAPTPAAPATGASPANQPASPGAGDAVEPEEKQKKKKKKKKRHAEEAQDVVSPGGEDQEEKKKKKKKKKDKADLQ